VDETITLEANEDYKPKWSTSDNKVAAIDAPGKKTASIEVTAVGVGEAEITAVSGKQTAVYKITVLDPEEFVEKEEETEIEKPTVVIVVNGSTVTNTYNGEEQSHGGFTAASSSSEFDYSKVSLNRDISITGKDCGYYKQILTADDFRYDDDNVKAVFIVNEGYMKITPAKAKVQANELTKFAGEADPELTAQVTGLFGEDTIEYSLTRDAGEEAGMYLIKAEGEELQGNYRIQYINGIMTILEAPVEEKEPLVVEISSAISEDEPLFNGMTNTLTASVSGAAEGEYTIQWQYSDDMQNWTDIPGANSLTYTYEINGHTATYAWRAVVDRIE
jgi:hypothetical protein